MFRTNQKRFFERWNAWRQIMMLYRLKSVENYGMVSLNYIFTRQNCLYLFKIIKTLTYDVMFFSLFSIWFEAPDRLVHLYDYDLSSTNIEVKPCTIISYHNIFKILCKKIHCQAVYTLENHFKQVSLSLSIHLFISCHSTYKTREYVTWSKSIWNLTCMQHLQSCLWWS
jgi:hypothetical protein